MIKNDNYSTFEATPNVHLHYDAMSSFKALDTQNNGGPSYILWIKIKRKTVMEG